LLGCFGLNFTRCLGIEFYDRVAYPFARAFAIHTGPSAFAVDASSPVSLEAWSLTALMRIER
jgi:hypothetical protein